MGAKAGLGVVTGASSGIGKELARCFAEHGFDVVVVAEDEAVHAAAGALGAGGATVTPVQADLATFEGVEQLVAAVEAVGAPVEALAVNAGIGVHGRFVETELADHLQLIGLNITGAVHLTRRLLPAMVERGAGRLLFTSSIAAMMPGPYLSTYAASKSFLYSFAEALRKEVADRGVTVTALMPGPTETDFFERADMEDTKLGQAKKDDAGDVAREGFEAMLAGKDHAVAGSAKNNVQALAGKVLPGKASATAHAAMAEPGSG